MIDDLSETFHMTNMHHFMWTTSMSEKKNETKQKTDQFDSCVPQRSLNNEPQYVQAGPLYKLYRW